MHLMQATLAVRCWQHRRIDLLHLWRHWLQSGLLRVCYQTQVDNPFAQTMLRELGTHALSYVCLPGIRLALHGRLWQVLDPEVVGHNASNRGPDIVELLEGSQAVHAMRTSLDAGSSFDASMMQRFLASCSIFHMIRKVPAGLSDIPGVAAESSSRCTLQNSVYACQVCACEVPRTWLSGLPKHVSWQCGNPTALQF
jgi:hypothetical protein